MGRLYLLFKTDEFVVKDIVAVHESLEVLLALLKNNHELAEPKRLGQGWEIDLMTYDDTGKAIYKGLAIEMYGELMEKANETAERKGKM